MLRPAKLLLFSSFLSMAAGGAMAEADWLSGNWTGTYRSPENTQQRVSAQAIAEGRGQYRLVVTVPAVSGERPTFELNGREEGRQASFSGQFDASSVNGEVYHLSVEGSGRELRGSYRSSASEGNFRLQKVEKRPPSLGAAPPQGATVLFDGSSLDGWQRTDGAAAQWQLTGDAMEVRRGNVISKAEFGDARYHVEFRTPFMPEERGQKRGNSGVYLQGRYEVQVLDSFGLEPKDNECGGIYRIAAPRVNATLPPLEWQTYEITFRAPRFDSAGNKIQDAEISVLHNGILIHDRVRIPAVTGGAVSQSETPKAGLMLQDHGDPVQYRNIWVLPLD